MTDRDPLLEASDCEEQVSFTVASLASFESEPDERGIAAARWSGMQVARTE